jgi:hypothetical protein
MIEETKAHIYCHNHVCKEQDRINSEFVSYLPRIITMTVCATMTVHTILVKTANYTKCLQEQQRE